MDQQLEVKKTRSWAFRTVKWVLITVLVVAGGVIGAASIYNAYRERLESRTAALPVREQNLVIFDAACRILKDHYYDPDLFKTETWRAYEAGWRQKAIESEPGIMLYVNVLGNFGGKFLESHVGFEQPQSTPTPSAVPLPSPSAEPAHAQSQAAWAERWKIWDSGQGFDVVSIRRGTMTTQVVGDVVPGSAAARAGVTPGWAVPFFVKTVDDRGVRVSATFLELTGDPALELERTGLPPGVESAGPEDPYTLEHGVKREIELELLPVRKPFEIRHLDGGMSYVRFDNFMTSSIIDRTLDAIDAAGPQGLIVDLRHNTGGMSWYLQRLLGRLLGNDVVVGELRDHESRSAMRTWRWGAHYEGPVVVLIGPESTSAAEIAAASLQDLGRAKLIGRMTNGCVLSSKKFALPDGGIMMVPVRDYHRIGGSRIEGIGVTPDIRVVPALEEVRAGRDPVLERAVEELRKTSAAPFNAPA